MKRNLLLVAVGILFVISCVVVFGQLKHDKESKASVAAQSAEPEVSVTPEKSTADFELPNATVFVPQTPGNPRATLQNGKAEYNQDGYQAYLTMLKDYTAEKQTSEGYDLFGVLSVNYGGSGNFMYLTLVRYLADAAHEEDSLELGSQIVITDLRVQDDTSGVGEYEVIVSFNELAPGQAMAEAPSVPVTKTLKVKDHKFLE